MKKYDVIVTERYQRIVTVEADDPEEAKELASYGWQNTAYSIDAKCFKGVDFKATRHNRARDFFG